MDKTERLPDLETEKESLNQTSASRSNRSSPRFCRFYSQGLCAFGKRCKFLHQFPEAKEELQGAESYEQKPQDSSGYDAEISEVLKDSCQVQNVSEKNADLKNSGSVLHKGKDKFSKPCKFFLSGCCTWEDKCRFWHPEQLPPLMHYSGIREKCNEKWRPSSTVHKRAPCEEVKLHELTAELAKQLRETEINQLIKRFPKDQLIIQEREDGKLTYYRVTVQPTDPDWPFDLKELDIMISFPDDYPQEVFSVDVPEDQYLPSVMGRYVCKSSQEWVKAKHETNKLMGKVELLFRPFLRWLDRNMERLFTEGARMLKRDIDAERSGIEFVPYQQLKTSSTYASCQNENPAMESNLKENLPRSNSCSNSSDEEDGNFVLVDTVSDDDDDDVCAEQTTSHLVENIKSSEPRKGTEIKLLGLQLGEDIATLEANEITISLQCNRCKITADLTITKKNPCTAECEKCNAHISAAFRHSIIHHYSDVLGYLDLNGAVPADLVLSNCEFVVGCLNCSEKGLLMNLSYGYNKEFNCTYCYRKLNILVESVKFQYIQPRARTETAPTFQQHRKFYRDPAVQSGKPLPEKGTCKHYRQSYRWLRFPCCGRAYPCDICHNEAQNHEMELATRMICGYCAKEQPYSNGTLCISCGSFMTRGSHTSHWEGGQGCRNKLKMARKDKQKYANISKTVSRKSSSLKK
ncbi:uncharacterized protein si:dkey-24l11.2 [Polypterus senegalus]|uniref:uncharacterized protein si:dkey-24l11.2 n=1 Tax=Polypterus senegalus TaxID=55291 RepID=UPI0019668130|nr:uncharacterized protein si:dkey-24l11.2 [Polypterus senegalus]